MSTPVATVADALISFILSLLRDPAAVEEFDAAPKAALANHGLEDACAADVQAVKPVIVDNPTVIVKTVSVPPPRRNDDNEVVREISRIVHQFTTVDARSTIVDQSVNQNIWTNGGDVTQIFDQDSVVASGDHAVAAGDDATVVDTDVDIDISDVSVGNTTIEDSYNDNEVEVVVEEVEAAPVLADDDASADPEAVVTGLVDGALDAADSAAQDASSVAQSVAPAQEQAPAEDPLAADLTSADAYASEDSSSMGVDDAYVEEPVEDQ